MGTVRVAFRRLLFALVVVVVVVVVVVALEDTPAVEDDVARF